MQNELYFKTYLQTYIMNLIKWSLKTIIKVEEGSKFWVFVYFDFFPLQWVFHYHFQMQQHFENNAGWCFGFFFLFSPWSDELIFSSPIHLLGFCPMIPHSSSSCSLVLLTIGHQLYSQEPWLPSEQLCDARCGTQFLWNSFH